jgi:hypothetical protein
MHDFPAAMEKFSTLVLECLENGVPKQQKKPPELTKSGDSVPLAALSDVVVMLEGVGLKPFPASGTLLGWWREGRFLSHDKDIDIALPPESDWQLTLDTITSNSTGHFQRCDNGYDNLIALKHLKTGITVDIIQHTRTSDGQIRCVWKAKGLAEERCRETLQSDYTLVRDEWLGRSFWRPDDPDRYLTDLYGDWRTPMQYFDTTIAGHHIVGFPEIVRCMAYNRLASNLLEGHLAKVLAYAGHILDKDPTDPLASRVRDALDAEINVPADGVDV